MPTARPTKAAIRERLLKEHGTTLEPLEHVKPLLIDDDLLPTLANFIAAHPTFARRLFDVHGRVADLGCGIGRGEVLIYFLYDEVTLGGTTSSIDIHLSGVPFFEVKAAWNRGNGIWADFRLGTDEFTASHRLVYQVVELMLRQETKGNIIVPEHFGNIPKTVLDRLRKLAPKAIKQAEDDYFKKLFSGRVGSKKFLFFDTKTALPVYYGKLEREMLYLERFSAGQTKLLFNPTGFK